MEPFSLQNIVQGNGVAISITGMAIVFSGLIFMSIFIKLLPVILEKLDKKPEKQAAVKTEPVKRSAAETVEPAEAPLSVGASVAAEAETEDDESKDIASLIGLILHLESERFYASDNRYITINRNGERQSLWGRIGRMRQLPQRRGYAKI